MHTRQLYSCPSPTHLLQPAMLQAWDVIIFVSLLCGEYRSGREWVSGSF